MEANFDLLELVGGKDDLELVGFEGLEGVEMPVGVTEVVDVGGVLLLPFRLEEEVPLVVVDRVLLGDLLIVLELEFMILYDNSLLSTSTASFRWSKVKKEVWNRLEQARRKLKLSRGS